MLSSAVLYCSIPFLENCSK